MPNTISLPMGPMPMGVNAATMAAAAYTATRYTTPNTMHSIATKIISWSFQPPLAEPFSLAIPVSPLEAKGSRPRHWLWVPYSTVGLLTLIVKCST